MDHRFRKAVQVCSIVLSVAIIVLAAMQIFDVWTDIAHLYIPLLGLDLLLQAYLLWKSSRSVAVFSICAAVFSFGCAAAVYILK